ncbi:putative Phytocyanin domain, cupredoxin [Dioscorea sansibarensis]
MESHFPLVFFFSFLMISFAILFKNTLIEAKDYTVGDSDGWTTGENYLKWSEKYNFTVGDTLVFKYVLNQHNVYQVTETTFRSCDTSSGVISIHLSGNDRIELTEPTKYWFICNTKGHCKGGMRFGINVTATSGETLPPPSDGNSSLPPPPPPPVTAPGGNAAAHGQEMRWWLCALVVLFDLVYW